MMTFVKAHETVRPADVAAHYGIASNDAARILGHLADRGLVARIKRGVYTADRELARRVLSAKLDSLMATL
ncbi:hypothetical protein AFM11_20980 [Mycolicibacterium wolinskyi]|uniref:AbiEi antitoxin N-terminal domain-containing protein n=2 Tax=Mycolicibacterium wolinskyi TaxID=59750 RepID=A0A132PIX8_9MYCO|nr:hypothetical protein AFM11_20980 [Mycolicibacterium wolinskyi]